MNTSFLVDANVWLALLFAQHPHWEASRRWFGELRPEQAGLCRVMHLSLIRLLANPAVLGDSVLSPAEACARVGELLEDERVKFQTEPADLDKRLLTTLRAGRAARDTVTDAYLAAFAIAGGLQLATFDRGFRRFEGLDLLLLEG